MTIHTEQGFILTRHWSDTPQGIAVSYWLATENGPRKVTVAKQYAIGFVAQQNESILRSVVGHNRDIDIRPLALKDFERQPVLGFIVNNTANLPSLNSN